MNKIFIHFKMENSTIIFIVLLIVIVVIIVTLIVLFLIFKNSGEETEEESHITVDAVLYRAPLDNSHHSHQKIPKKIMQTNVSNQIPQGMYDTVNTILKLNPEYEYIYYSDETSEVFIKENYGHRMLKAYQNLIPGAYKADLFRYCYLYKHGGIYIDTGMVAQVPFRELIKENDEFVAPEDAGYGKGIYNAFMCSIPEHPIIGEVLRIVLNNIESHDKRYDMLATTGPVALGEAFTNHTGKSVYPNINYGNGIRLIRHQSGYSISGDSKNIVGEIDDNNLLILKTKYPTYYKDRVWYHSKEHYGILWQKDEVFKTKPEHNCPPKIAPPIHERKVKQVIKHRVPLDHNNKRQSIPKIIIQTNEDDKVPEKMFNAIQSFLNDNEEYEYFYFNAHDRRKFIKEEFHSDVLGAYDKFIPGAYQADLFRYCYLYRKGGVYIDSGMVSMRPLREMIREKDKLILPEDDKHGGVCNGFMASIPKHPFFKIAIQKIIKHAKEEYYGESSLQITGPALLAKIFRNLTGKKIKENKTYSNGIRTISHQSAATLHNDPCPNPGEIDSDGLLFLKTKYPLYQIDMVWYHKREHYDTLWTLRQIYK
jgi:mannosyltransferase OCH1-like enzyme